MRMILTAALLLGGACTTAPADSEAPEPNPANGTCDTEALGGLIGRQATQELGAEALRLSGARGLRWIRPGDAVTMDYRPDRLNVHLDGQGRVERFNCG